MMNKCPDPNRRKTLKDLDGSQGHEALKCYYYTTLSGLASQNEAVEMALGDIDGCLKYL